MNRKPALLFSGTLIGYMLAIALWAYLQIPAGTRIATHFDAQGRPNGYGETWTLFLVPLIAIGLGALLALIPSIEPRRANLAGSANAYGVGPPTSPAAQLTLAAAARPQKDAPAAAHYFRRRLQVRLRTPGSPAKTR